MDLDLSKAYELAESMVNVHIAEPGAAWTADRIIDATLPHIIDALAAEAQARAAYHGHRWRELYAEGDQRWAAAHEQANIEAAYTALYLKRLAGEARA